MLINVNACTEHGAFMFMFYVRVYYCGMVGGGGLKIFQIPKDPNHNIFGCVRTKPSYGRFALRALLSRIFMVLTFVSVLGFNAVHTRS